jgi:5-methylcytosine-specific restriction endonuclease McrA
VTDILLPPFSTIKRKTPVKRVRAKARPNRLKGAAMTEMREQVFDRDKGLCVRCGKPGSDLSHKRNKRMWGDSPENTEVMCRNCHRLFHQYGPSFEKPCPPKQRIEENS